MKTAISVRVAHPGFPTVNLPSPIDWTINPYNSGAWSHHFMSLRWLHTARESSYILFILRSFYNFHCERRIRNAYYDKLRGDHAATLRIKQVLAFKEKFLASHDHSAAGLCDRIIDRDVENLQSPEMYRAGHNHGLMVDIVLLSLAQNNNRYKSKIDCELISARGRNTLDSMFTPNGVTCEHSISYQEFNFPLAVEFLELCGVIFGADRVEYKEKLTAATKRLLHFATRDCGQYFALGDTLKLPATQTRENHPEIVQAKALSEIGTPGNRVYCQDGFFFYKRVMPDEKKGMEANIHFAATCVWHSFNHKQDDELSFCLEAEGNLIFDDPGYTVHTNSIDETLRPASSHSTINIPTMPFSSTSSPANGSEIGGWNENELGFHLTMSHRRINGHVVRRTFDFSGSLLTIHDCVESESWSEADIQHGFVLSPDVYPSTLTNGFALHKDEKIIALLTTQDYDGSWQILDQNIVGTNKFEYKKTKKIVYSSKSRYVSFQIQI